MIFRFVQMHRPALPVDLPIISDIILNGVSPRVMACPWHLYAVNMQSPMFKARSTPVTTASCPSYKWQNPLISPVL